MASVKTKGSILTTYVQIFKWVTVALFTVVALRFCFLGMTYRSDVTFLLGVLGIPLVFATDFFIIFRSVTSAKSNSDSR